MASLTKTLVLKHPAVIRWCHWINVPILAVMIWSGLLIYWANDVYRVGVGTFTLFRFFPEWFYSAFNVSHRLAEGMAWHFTFMWLFAVNGLVYVSYVALAGKWRYRGLQRYAYVGIVLMGAGSLLTGLAIYKPTQLSWLTSALGGYQYARAEHFWLTVGFVLFVLVHVAQVVRSGWGTFRAMIAGYEAAERAESRP